MAAKTYRSRCIVLRKRARISEKDLIVTLLDESGRLVSAVAKGALKPGGSLAAKMEPFNVLDCMLASGRSLDIVTEARLDRDHDHTGYTMEQGILATPVAELASVVAQEGLELDRFFDMTLAALDIIGDADNDSALGIVCAYLVKALALAGYRPSFERCVGCGKQIVASETPGPVAVSILEGGAYCADCTAPPDVQRFSADVIGWCNALMRLTFREVAESGIGVATSFSVISFEQQWIRAHLGRNLKSLDFLLASGLF